MKYVDFSSLLDGNPAYIAFLSTYQFDPDFFERRLLRCTTLSKARRIVIFLDSRQWVDLLRRDVHARWLNRRYLVVPVRRPQGAFHPKLSLLLNDTGGQVLCGSNNLTRSGCSSNLELLNSMPFDFSGVFEEEIDIAKEAFEFFKNAAMHSDEQIVRIANEWIEETAKTFPWLEEPIASSGRTTKLLHTYDGGIWDRLVQHLAGAKPSEFFIVSPFHDSNGELAKRLAAQWPTAQLEFLVQQEYTALALNPLKKLRKVRLSVVKDSSRRIHAKLLAWRTRDGGGCLAGSANFTSAAFDGRNVEACLLITPAGKFIDSLFDNSFSKHPLPLKGFVPGETESCDTEAFTPSLRINSAVLTGANHLQVSYTHKLDLALDSLRLTLRTPGENHPRISINIPKKQNSTEIVPLPGSALADSHGTLLASLQAEFGEERIESLPVWVIQECRLTYEPSEGSSTSQSNIEETGEGLPEYLDELGKRDGLMAVVDYLRHLNIRFQGGGVGAPGQRKFRLTIRDPFHPDIAPEWLIESSTKAPDLEAAIYEFADRHQKKHLQKHARLGNINGINNFLDILTTLVHLLYAYYKRGIVKRGKLISRLCSFVELATIGKETDPEPFDGFLYSMCDSLSGDVDLLQNVCNDTNYLAEVRAALLILQSVRYDPKETPTYGPKATRPREVLQHYAKAVDEGIRECYLNEPNHQEVRLALERYRMFSGDEVDTLLAELPECSK